MALSADERKLLRKIVTDRSERAKSKVERSYDAAARETERKVPVDELPASDPRRAEAEEYNAAVAVVKKVGERLDPDAARLNYGYVHKVEKLSVLSKREAEKKKARLLEECNAKLEAIEEATTETQVAVVAAGLADAQLKDFTEKLDKLVGGGA